jgi:hypothetical protein
VLLIHSEPDALLILAKAKARRLNNAVESLVFATS